MGMVSGVRALKQRTERELLLQVTLEWQRSALASEQLSLQLPKHLCGAGLCRAGGRQRLFINAWWQRSLTSVTVHMHFLCCAPPGYLCKVTMESDSDLDLVLIIVLPSAENSSFVVWSRTRWHVDRRGERDHQNSQLPLSPGRASAAPPFFSHFGNRKEAPGRGEGDAPRLTFPRAWAESRICVPLHNKGCSDMNCIDVRARASVTI